jgi:hypothetical protein
MPGKNNGLRKRLAAIEQRLAEMERREELANCNCKDRTSACAAMLEEFEAEMKVTCPTHGFRRLGQITRLSFVEPDGTECGNTASLEQLLAEYDARYTRHSNAELEHDSQES